VPGISRFLAPRSASRHSITRARTRHDGSEDPSSSHLRQHTHVSVFVCSSVNPVHRARTRQPAQAFPSRDEVDLHSTRRCKGARTGALAHCQKAHQGYFHHPTEDHRRAETNESSGPSQVRRAALSGRETRGNSQFQRSGQKLTSFPFHFFSFLVVTSTE